MEEERNQQVGVSSYVRDKSIRKANRNGYKSRSLNTRVGVDMALEEISSTWIEHFAALNEGGLKISDLTYLMPIKD